MSGLLATKCIRSVNATGCSLTTLRSRRLVATPKLGRQRILPLQSHECELQVRGYSALAANYIARSDANKSTPIAYTTISSSRSLRAIPISCLEGKRSQHSQAQESTANIDHAPVIASYPEWIKPQDTLPRRHIGPTDEDIATMLKKLNQPSLEAFIGQTIPESIRSSKPFTIPSEQTPETEMLDELTKAGKANSAADVDTYIGMGYHPTITPGVIKRNVLENPGWYTSYTPYQPEISQGRLESLLNFQTVVTELTGLPLANASLLDEGTAAAEAMAMAYASSRMKHHTFLVDKNVYPQTAAVIRGRAEGLGITVVETDLTDLSTLESHKDDLIGVLVQYPRKDGTILDYTNLSDSVHSYGGQLICAADLLSLTILKPPSTFNADIVVGSAQRFGVPMGFGGPHAAFFACSDANKRKLPGRLVGVSKDRLNGRAFRLSLQTREQHIRREKATSNICTSQALLANMSAFYAIYHGPQGLIDIATRIHQMTQLLATVLSANGWTVLNDNFFDTLTLKSAIPRPSLASGAGRAMVSFSEEDDNVITLSLNETTTIEKLEELASLLCQRNVKLLELATDLDIDTLPGIPSDLQRTTKFLQQPVFNSYHSETELLRYIHLLQSKDLSLTHSMIPLGSCTMKLNATSEMEALTQHGWSSVHPFQPADSVQGYKYIIEKLSADLQAITGLDQISLQPNSGAQGELVGLRVIRAYHNSQGQEHRNVCLIPVSAHGTNPASAAMAGMKVIPVRCDVKGNLDMVDLKKKAVENKEHLGAIMVTYPSTFGVFEEGIREVCEIVHENGGQVYMDGANMNAQIGLCSPGDLGADVCHLNLHKTFCIPHGGGGPGVGPIGVKSHLAPYLPAHPLKDSLLQATDKSIEPSAAAPFGSASILLISYAYIKMMGAEGLSKATKVALLNANYMRSRLAPHYKILYTNKNDMCAHEFILDAREFKESAGIEAIDIAKRLQDFGFHAPTMSWPVPNTLMIEPTESESLRELDRFCDALIQIRKEIKDIETGEQPRKNNILVNAPHPMADLLREDWDRPYAREQAGYPLPWLKVRKFWPHVARLDDSYGDLNLFCTCDPVPEQEGAL